MTVDNVITSVLGSEDFSQYEQTVYEKHQEMAEREIMVRIKSGQPWKVYSPVFLHAKPKRKRGRSPKRQQGALRHLGLELLGIINRLSSQ